jgi:hypothetical protein
VKIILLTKFDHIGLQCFIPLLNLFEQFRINLRALQCYLYN